VPAVHLRFCQPGAELSANDCWAQALHMGSSTITSRSGAVHVKVEIGSTNYAGRVRQHIQCGTCTLPYSSSLTFLLLLPAAAAAAYVVCCCNSCCAMQVCRLHDPDACRPGRPAPHLLPDLG
jgi:hypothetical protein